MFLCPLFFFTFSSFVRIAENSSFLYANWCVSAHGTLIHHFHDVSARYVETCCTGVVDDNSPKVGKLDNMLVRPLPEKLRIQQDLRYTAMCAVDLRPFSMIETPAFKWFLGGFSQSYVHETVSPQKIAENLDKLCSQVRAAMTLKLKEQYESVRAMDWTGPWVSVQCDATSTNNTEYFTVSFSWIPPDWSGMERVAFCTKAFPGKHTAVEIEPWIRQVRKCHSRAYLHFVPYFLTVYGFTRSCIPKHETTTVLVVVVFRHLGCFCCLANFVFASELPETTRGVSRPPVAHVW